MGKTDMSLKEILEDIVKGIESGDRKRVRIIPGINSDFLALTSELEKRGIGYYKSNTVYASGSEDYVVNLSLIKLI